MRVETLELLRCPAAHAPSPLVTIATAREGDRLTDGTLGCPICGAQYELEHGVVHFGESGVQYFMLDGETDPTRVAALIALTEPGARVGLCGIAGPMAATMDLAFGSRVLAINASSLEPPMLSLEDLDRVEASLEASISASWPDAIELPVRGALPLADGALDALVVDDAHVSLLADAARVVRAGGRVLAPVHAPVPAGCRELARDAEQWVAEVTDAVSAPVALTSRRRTP